MVVTLAIVVGASRMPRERLATAIAAMAMLWLVVYVALRQTGMIGTNIRLVLGLEPWTAIIAGLALVWIDSYRQVGSEHRGDKKGIARGRLS